MNLFSLKAAQTVERTDQGRLRLSVLTADRNQPIDDASVSISYSGDPDSVIEEANTDSSGHIPELTLPAPLWNTVWRLLNISLTQSILSGFPKRAMRTWKSPARKSSLTL